MKKNSFIWIGVAAVAAWFLFFRGKADVKSQLIDYVKNNFAEPKRTNGLNSIALMTDQEIQDTSNYLFNYQLKGISLNSSDPLFARIQTITLKYNIFS